MEDLRHEGVVQVKRFTSEQFAPLDGVVQWRGRGVDLESFSGQVQSGQTTLDLRGSAHARQAMAGLRFDQFTLTRAINLYTPSPSRSPSLSIALGRKATRANGS